MLPRIAALDRDFNNAFKNYVQLRSRQSPILNEIKSHVIHEGKSSAIRRGPQDSEHTEMFEATVETKLDFKDIEAVNISFVIAKANEISKQFERQFSMQLFKTMEETTKKTGQNIDARGAPLTNDLLFEMFSRMHIDFESSQDGDLTIVTSPQMAPKFQKLELEMIENPEIRKKWNQMMEKKRDEFREREINRNLAG